MELRLSLLRRVLQDDVGEFERVMSLVLAM